MHMHRNVVIIFSVAETVYNFQIFMQCINIKEIREYINILVTFLKIYNTFDTET